MGLAFCVSLYCMGGWVVGWGWLSMSRLSRVLIGTRRGHMMGAGGACALFRGSWGAGVVGGGAYAQW